MKTRRKEIKCFTCSNIILVSKYTSKYTICQECKDKGITPQIPNRNKTKFIKCYFCDNIVEVGLASSNQVRCNECKKKGLVTPDSLMKQEKRKQVLVEKYGVENVSSLSTIQDKKKNIRKEKIENDPEYLNEIERKRKETINEKYGSVEEFYKISSKKYFEKTGYNTPFENPEVQKKIQKNNINPMRKEEVKEKVKKTNLEKYGFEWPTQSEEVKDKIKDLHRIKFIPKLKEYLNELDLELLEDYNHAHYLHRFRCKKCGTEFERIWNLLQQGAICPNCTKRNYNSSKPEKEIQEFILSFKFNNVSFNNRNFIYPWELDVIIHDEKVAIEYSGLWYHNERILGETRKNLKDPKKYHSMKRELCLEKGYRLITIFEDEWIFKKDIVLNRICQIIQKSSSDRIHARNCTVKEIDSSTKNEFLEKFHIQGKDASIIKLGAFYNNELISVMTFSRGNISKGSKNEEDIFELSRFCSDYKYHIPGIASKLLSFFKLNYKWKEIFTYADLRWSNGNMYHKLGFITDNKIRLNYWYVKDFNRIHRFNLRKRKDEPKNVSEFVLRLKEGYNIIWDCGNLKFRMINV